MLEWQSPDYLEFLPREPNVTRFYPANIVFRTASRWPAGLPQGLAKLPNTSTRAVTHHAPCDPLQGKMVQAQTDPLVQPAIQGGHEPGATTGP